MSSVTNVQSTVPVDDVVSPTLTTTFEAQQRAFYDYLGNTIREWCVNIRTGPKSDDDLSATPATSCIDMWSYKLLTEKGIKRRRIQYGGDLPNYADITRVEDLPSYDDLVKTNVLGESESDRMAYLDKVKSGSAFQRAFYGKSNSTLFQFYYDKKSPKYDKTDLLTAFCRHLVFDLNTLSIISVGVPGAVPYDIFMQGRGESGIVVEEYLEGTMIVYNNRLGHFNEKVKISDTQEVHSDGGDIDSNKPVKTPQKDWNISTRRKIGTSFFNNPGMTFEQMFAENNTAAGIDLGVATANEYLDNHILVFNLEHKENRVINPDIINRNTLVAAYHMPTDFAGIRTSAMQVLNVVYNMGMPASGYESVDFAFWEIMQKHIIACLLTQVPIKQALNDLAQVGVTGVRIPNKVFEFHGTDPSKVLNDMIQNSAKFNPGFMLKYEGQEGVRSKIRNPTYKEMLNVKGTAPISITEVNKKNLFKTYWDLRQRDNSAKYIAQFIEIFNGPENGYSHIFAWYETLLDALSQQLFNVYHSVFVKHTSKPDTIPFPLKPLCGELHKAYRATQQPTSRDMVTQFIGNLDWNQVYWRLFGMDG